MLIDIGGFFLETRILGNPAERPVLILIQGLGTPLVRWPEALLDRLFGAGLCVVAFDNRDIGLSSRMDDLGMPDMTRFRGMNPLGLPLARAMPLPYTLADMADDVTRLMDALHIRKAHVAGASMGGMIAQIVAASVPERCRSLTSIMSSSGNPLLPPPTPAALKALFSPLPLPPTEAAIVADSVWRQKILMSPGYPTSDDELAVRFAAEFRRGFHPRGVARQLAALLMGGDRRRMLARIRVPAAVLHGADDPLISVACGRDTAASIPGATLKVVSGMGHDFPDALVPVFAETILSAVRRAEGGAP